MQIHEAEPYKNKEGVEEKPHQYYYFCEYCKLPPVIRTVPNLYNVLEKKQQKNQLPYKLYKIKTVYKYKRQFDWDMRIFNNLGRDSKINHMENTDHLMNELWNDVLDYHQLTRKQKKKLKEWDNTEVDESEKVSTLNSIQKTYDQSLKTITGEPMGIAEMYGMLEVLKATEKNDDNKLELVDKLLHVEKDKGE